MIAQRRMDQDEEFDPGQGRRDNIEDIVADDKRRTGPTPLPPGLPPNDKGQSGTGPGEAGGPGQDSPGGNVAPRRPSAPTPVGGVSPGGPPEMGPMPFRPMGSPDIGLMATPRSSGLYGGLGGLKGGGIGVPMDPTSDQASDPISSLIKLLMRGQ